MKRNINRKSLKFAVETVRSLDLALGQVLGGVIRSTVPKYSCETCNVTSNCPD